MSRISLRVFFILALAVAVGLAVGVSPYASSSPDGLEKVAEDKGFLEDGTLHALQESSPIPDYAVPGVDDPRLATGLAGFLGTLAVALIALALGRLVLRRPVAGEDPAT
ncbi:MAG: PDGLE domain-containing protein [Gaiellaceae bacterium]